MSDKKQIKVSEVINLLNEGNNREQIAEHFGLTNAETKLLFSHEKLVNLRARKKKKEPSFEVLDDTETEESHVPSQDVVADQDIMDTEGHNNEESFEHEEEPEGAVFQE